MVRLCVPAGEDQHPLTPRLRLGVHATEPSLINSVYRSCILATGLTAVNAILGVARPGIFLKNVTFFGLLDGAVTACNIYGKQEINRAIFKMDGLDNPKPFKLWERTKEWTLEDATLFGGGTGLLIASNPRLLPGVSGFSRFFGMAIAGCAIGAQTGEFAFNRGPPHHTKRVEWVLANQRRPLYQQLSEDEKAKSSLSWYGQSLLASYTGESLIMRILSKPFGTFAGAAHSRGSAAVDHNTAPDFRGGDAMRHQMNEAHAKHPVLISVEFDKEELAAPDYDGAFRLYEMDSADVDLDTLQEHLEHLIKLRELEAKQLVYIWQILVPREHNFHQLAQENPEKDLLRHELQLLNCLALMANIRMAAMSHAQADARKRIAQIKNQDPAAESPLPLFGIDESSLDANWRETYIPQRIADRIRQHWEDSRADLARAEYTLAKYDEVKAQGVTNKRLDESATELRNNCSHIKQDVVATERLLKDFEDRIIKAEGNAGK